MFRYHQGIIIVVKTVTSSALAVLLVATLLWGGCLSCSQFFMLPTSGLQHCCKATGHCRGKVPAHSSSSRECAIQPIALGEIVPDTGLNANFIVAAAPMPIAPHLPALQLSGSAKVVTVDTGPPPDLCLLHSVFRV